MLEKLFERPHAVARHRSGPLCKERRRYLSYLARQHVPLAILLPHHAWQGYHVGAGDDMRDTSVGTRPSP